MLSIDYDVFVSFKNLMPDGTPTRDSIIARELHAFLEGNKARNSGNLIKNLQKKDEYS